MVDHVYFLISTVAVLFYFPASIDAFSWGELSLLTVLVCITLVVSDIWHFFLYFFAISVFERCLLRSSAHF
jgi:hypothetical protein